MLVTLCTESPLTSQFNRNCIIIIMFITHQYLLNTPTRHTTGLTDNLQWPQISTDPGTRPHSLPQNPLLFELMSVWPRKIMPLSTWVAISRDEFDHTRAQQTWLYNIMVCHFVQGYISINSRIMVKAGSLLALMCHLMPESFWCSMIMTEYQVN